MFVRGLAECVKAYGGVIHTNNEVLKFELDQDKIRAVHTSDFVAYPEVVVMAAGAWSPKLLRPLGMRISLQPAKGYSITISNQGGKPRLPLYLSEDKIAITPLGERLRISGILDFTGMDLGIEKRRLQTILEAARGALDLPLNGDEVQEWCGLRPCTPDGLPIIGRSELYNNLILATGHCMLGITLAPVTAELVFKIIEGDEVDVPLEAISLERFR
jgi:D-amino-acid dehydrogenase